MSMNSTTKNLTYDIIHCERKEQDNKLFDLPKEWLLFMTITMAAVVISTVIGNALVIVVFATSDVLKSSVNNLFLVSLAVADFLVGLFVMPCAVDAMRTQTWRCGAFKHFNAFGNFFFCISSIMHLMILSVDKYFSIVKPLKYPQLISKGRAIAVCIILWIYSGFWALLPLLGVSSYECFIPYIGVCASTDWTMNGLNFLFAISVVSGTYGVALIVMFIVYFRIAKIIRGQIRRIDIAVLPDNKNFKTPVRTHTNKTSFVKRYKGLVTLIILIITYLVCWSPFCIMLFIEIARAKKIEGTALMIGMLIGLINSCCNPIIYWAQYRRFRRATMRLLRRELFFLPMSMGSQNLVFSISRAQIESTLKSVGIQINRRVIDQPVLDLKAISNQCNK